MDGNVDFLREALRVLVDGIMDAEVSAQIGAEYGERTPDRVAHCNGYGTRSWDTGGTIDLHIPKIREGCPASTRIAGMTNCRSSPGRKPRTGSTLAEGWSPTPAKWLAGTARQFLSCS